VAYKSFFLPAPECNYTFFCFSFSRAPRETAQR
jgi:hypothetical protein